MAAEKTRAELSERVLQLLGVTAAGQPVAPEDAALVDSQIETVLEQLAALRIAYIGDPENIALRVFQDVAVMVADAVSTDFGKSGAMRVPDASGSSPYDRAQKNLRVINAGQTAYGTLESQYF